MRQYCMAIATYWFIYVIPRSACSSACRYVLIPKSIVWILKAGVKIGSKRHQWTFDNSTTPAGEKSQQIRRQDNCITSTAQKTPSPRVECNPIEPTSIAIY
ncbi:hypothetical protein Agabi119p4_8787 [Agaricus bisporus var. burnettii]|uniref:Uncharacterized protein n=1 Tax=Agaricus bisporus var. burnettii TaxID=192524 RepID=A0A8H7C3T6_AGABI|nr:hypothetical protein Agabi119p4_8787 [Agaricus bisporus var. burnettii]